MDVNGDVRSCARLYSKAVQSMGLQKHMEQWEVPEEYNPLKNLPLQIVGSSRTYFC